MRRAVFALLTTANLCLAVNAQGTPDPGGPSVPPAPDGPAPPAETPAPPATTAQPAAPDASTVAGGAAPSPPVQAGSESAAAGATTAKPDTSPADAPTAEESPTMPNASNLLRGHLVPTITGFAAVPFGSLERGLPWFDVAGPGAGVGLELALGVSRSVAMGLWVDWARLGSASECDGCSTTALAGGLLVRYHLVQGMRFDPHVAFGVGMRTIAATGTDRDLDYLGVDWLRLVLGGDWYVTSHLALAPFTALAAGTPISGPQASPVRLAPGEDRRSSVYGTVQIGLRISLDVSGR